MGGSWRRRKVVGGSLVDYVAIRKYGVSLTRVAKVMNISVQSLLRGVDRGGEEFRKREWAIMNKPGKNSRIGIIGIGSMGTGLLYQANITRGVDCVAISDIHIERCIEAAK